MTALKPNVFVTVIETDDRPLSPAQTTAKVNCKILSQ